MCIVLLLHRATVLDSEESPSNEEINEFVRINRAKKSVKKTGEGTGAHALTIGEKRTLSIIMIMLMGI